MSSEHAIIVARNTKTGELQLPLDEVTIYDTNGYGLDGRPDGVGSVKIIIDSVRMTYSDDWVITLYVRSGPDWCGSRRNKRIDNSS